MNIKTMTKGQRKLLEEVAKEVESLSEEYGKSFIKTHIRCVVANSEQYRSLDYGYAPYEKLEDLVVICRIRMDIKEGRKDILVTNEVMRYLGMSENELFETAKENNDIFEPTIISPLGYRVFVLTNPERMYGASAILNESTLSDAAEMLDTNVVVIIPSSIHEILVSKYDEEKTAEYLDMVRAVNRTEVAVDDRLSDNIYLFDNRTKKIKVVTE